jgi:2-polyprenyl-3-methyl-5-hydroxy-6-metoxy-1,4-benzoquinol methylase
MSDIQIRQKWDGIYKDGQRGAAARVLAENRHLLPTSGGRGLDVASGMGANAVLLAQHGLEVDAWDISPVATEQLQSFATENNLGIHAAARNIVEQPPGVEEYDVIVVSHFLERELMPKLIDALKPGGLLFYQTFSRARVDDSGPRNEAFRLRDNELLEFCSAMRILVYREEGAVGNTREGFRNLAMIVAQKK